MGKNKISNDIITVLQNTSIVSVMNDIPRQRRAKAYQTCLDYSLISILPDGEHIELTELGLQVLNDRILPDLETANPKIVYQDPSMLTASDLKLRDKCWTETAIKSLLPNPDLHVTNPKYKRAAPMRLWLLSRVIKAEATAEFHIRKEAFPIRSNAARKASATALARREELGMRFMEELDIHVEKVSNVQALAIESYNDWNFRRIQSGLEPYATKDSPKDFLNRITLNFIRHELTDYDEVMGLLKRLCLDYFDVKDRYMEAIYQCYPKLTRE